MGKPGCAPLRTPAYPISTTPQILLDFASEFQMRILKLNAVTGVILIREPQFKALCLNILQNVTAVIGAEPNVF